MWRVSIRRTSWRSWSLWPIGTPVNFKDLYTEGITHITPLDIAYAQGIRIYDQAAGHRQARRREVEARVHPTMLPSDSPIAKVEGVYNAIQLVGDAVGDVVLYRAGRRGSLPTGSAVVSDIIAIARNLLKGAAGRVPPASFQQDQRRPLRMRPMEEISSSTIFGLWSRSPRCVVADRRGAGPLRYQHLFGVAARTAGGADGAGRHQDPYREGARCANRPREINRMAFISEPTTLIRVEGKDE